MISDVLAEAIDKIQKYQAEFPAVYTTRKEQIDYVVNTMQTLRYLLDKPPSPSERGHSDHSARRN